MSNDTSARDAAAREAAAKRYRDPPDAWGIPTAGAMTVSGAQLVALERGAFVEGATWAHAASTEAPASGGGVSDAMVEAAWLADGDLRKLGYERTRYAIAAALAASQGAEGYVSCGSVGPGHLAGCNAADESGRYERDVAEPNREIYGVDVEAARTVLKRYRKGFWHINGAIVREALDAAYASQGGATRAAHDDNALGHPLNGTTPEAREVKP